MTTTLLIDIRDVHAVITIGQERWDVITVVEGLIIAAVEWLSARSLEVLWYQCITVLSILSPRQEWDLAQGISFQSELTVLNGCLQVKYRDAMQCDPSDETESQFIRKKHFQP